MATRRVGSHCTFVLSRTVGAASRHVPPKGNVAACLATVPCVRKSKRNGSTIAWEGAWFPTSRLQVRGHTVARRLTFVGTCDSSPRECAGGAVSSCGVG